MRVIPTAVRAALEAGLAVERHLVWLAPRNRATNAVVPAGLWSGEGFAEIDVIDPATGDTVRRAYHGAGQLLAVEPPQWRQGLDIIPMRLTLSPISAEVEDLARGYDLRGTEVQVHRLWLDPETRAPLAPGQPWLAGLANAAPITTPVDGGTASLQLTIVPGATRALTVGNPSILGDEMWARTRSGDHFLRDIAKTGTRVVPWGTR